MVVEISVIFGLLCFALAWYFFGKPEEVVKPEPTEFSEIHVTRVYADYIEKGELE